MSTPAVRMVVKIGSSLVASAMIVLLCAACGGKVSPNFSYKAPAFLPFHINIGKTGGDPTISGNVSWITEVGVFSVGAQYELPPQGADYIYVILRNRRTGYDRIYKVKTYGDDFSAVVNGTTDISVSNDQVLIDVTSGDISHVTFRRVDNQIPEAGGGNAAQKTGHSVASRWDEGWARSWYHPFMLSSWAYDDSTVAKWYGIGFIWFALRLILAIVLGFIDLLFTILFFIGQIFVTLFGSSVWPGGLG